MPGMQPRNSARNSGTSSQTAARFGLGLLGMTGRTERLRILDGLGATFGKRNDVVTNGGSHDQAALETAHAQRLGVEQPLPRAVEMSAAQASDFHAGPRPGPPGP